MSVLEALESGRGAMSLTQIAQACQMAPSKAHRYLVSLGRAGLVVQSQRSGLYDLGPSMRRMGIESLRRTDEVALASEHLPDLRDRTSHAVNLAVWGESGPIIVRWDYGAHALPITVRVGATMPLLTSSVGQVYLAYLPEVMTMPLIAAERSTEGALPVSTGTLDELRRRVRDRGVAVTSGGVIPGVTSIAAPVFPPGGETPLAVAVALPARLADDRTLENIEQALIETVDDIGRDLGRSAGKTIRPVM